MVVHIKNPVEAIKLDAEIRQNRNNITPEYVLELLSKTNNYACIKQLFKELLHPCQDKNNTQEENALILQKIAKEYKDVLLMMVDAREHSPKNYETIRQIASAGGYLEELEAVDSNSKIYSARCNNVLYTTDASLSDKAFRGEIDLDLYDSIIFDTPKQSISLCLEENLRFIEYIDVFRAYFQDCDLTKTEIRINPDANMRIMKGAVSQNILEKKLNSLTLISPVIEFEGSPSRINFKAKNVTYLLNPWNHENPKILDFSQTEKVVFDTKSDLKGVEDLIFMPGSTVFMKYCENFPEKLDFSMCKEVYLENADLTGVSEIKFKDEEQKNRFLTDAKAYNDIKCVYTTNNFTTQFFNTYMNH